MSAPALILDSCTKTALNAGFAGTIQAFVPYDILDSFVAGIDGALGAGACHVLSIRPQGGVEAK